MKFTRPQVLASLEHEAQTVRNVTEADERYALEVGTLISEFAQLSREKSELLILVRTALAVLGTGNGSPEEQALLAAMRETANRVTR